MAHHNLAMSLSPSLRLTSCLRYRHALPSTSLLQRTAMKQQTSHFSTTQPLGKKGGGVKLDKRIRLIRYFLAQPRLPRPLRFSRQRHLRHWTIHRAWQMYQAKQRQKREVELERQYNSMREACEALRLMDGNGMVVEADGAEDRAGQVGRLYRMAMMKTDVWQGIPIEYARLQTESPPKHGWNHEWTR